MNLLMQKYISSICLEHCGLQSLSIFVGKNYENNRKNKKKKP